MWIMNLGKPVNIPPLNEQMAIELGANLLGEGIIFVLGASVVILEYIRSSNKEALREEERVQETEKLNNTINELYFNVQRQNTQIVELQRSLYDLENRVVVKPWVMKSDSQTSDEPPPTKPPGANSPSLALPQSQNTSKNATTPYPDKGVLMKSLNYLELSVLNTPQSNKKGFIKEPTNQAYTRKASLVNNALGYLEQDVRGIL